MSILTAHQAKPRTEAAKPILSINNIEVIYDHVILVLKGVSISVPKGESSLFSAQTVRANRPH